MKDLFRCTGVVVLFVLTLVLGVLPAQADPPQLKPRVLADKAKQTKLPENTEVTRLVIKFHEGTRVRLRGGHLGAQDRDERDRRDLEARGLTPAAVDNDVAEVRRLVAIDRNVRGLGRLFSMREEALAERRAAGESRGGRELADLDLYYELRPTPRATAGDVTELLDALNALESVEIAYAEPPAAPASLGRTAVSDASHTSGPTPNFQSLQGYLNPAPQGIDALYSWTLAGGKGQGVKIVDIEGGWRTNHEDLPVLFHAGGTQINDPYWLEHGTAVLGEVVAKDNGLGITGISNQSQAGYESIGSQSTADAIMHAASAVGPGGIVLIELHFGGPTSSSPCTCNQLQCYFVPAEYYSSQYDAIVNATANGTIVVEAGGNGSTNLDDPVYGNVFNRSYRDSGAILVAASNSYGRNPTCWTNWGSRIDVHGWGENVATLGYGDLFDADGPHRYYTAYFGGTSSASPIVTGAAANLQGRALATLPEALDPLVIRQVLKDTGTPQVPGAKNIGPLPNLRAAFDYLAANQPPVPAFTFTCWGTFCSFDASGSTDDRGISLYSWSFGDATSSAHSYPTSYRFYSGSGSYTVTLTVKDNHGVPASTSRVVNVTSEDHTVAAPESYVALPPCRLFDTRSSDPVIATGGILTSDQPRQLQMTGRCGVPSDAKAVAINVVAVFPTDRGNFQLYPGNLSGGITPTASLNFGTSNRANNAIVRLATNGAGTATLKPFVVGAGQVHMVMDVSGYFTESVTPAPGSAGPLGFQPVTPCRIADSRSGAPLNGAAVYPHTVQGGSCGVPAGAEAASLLLSVAQPSANGSAVLYSNDIAAPSTSTINFLAGTSLLTNSAFTKLAATTPDLAFRYAISGATTHAVIDTNGYFKAGAPLRYRPLTPCRVIDTRSAAWGAPALAHGVQRNVQVQGNCGVPQGAKAVFLNVVSWLPTAGGSVTAFAAGSAAPSIPTVSFDANEPALGNGVIVPLGTTASQDLALLANVPAGTVHAIVDVFGYFETDPGPSADFTFTCSGLTCSFDGTSSYDNIGIGGYSWNFGDSTSGSGATPSHTFTQGSYTVTLTVTDVFGQPASWSRVVSVSGETLPAESFFALPPCRLLDTRNAGTGGVLISGEVRPLQVAGGCGVPSTAKAVAVNLVAVSATNRGNLQFYPGDLAGGLTPTANLNFGTSNRANNAILRLGAGGTVKVNPFVAGGGTVHLVMDVNGYFSEDTVPAPGATGPLGYATINPCRIANQVQVVGGTPATFTAQGGRCPVPAGAAAIFQNLTALAPAANGNLLAYANGPQPATSTINVVAGTPALSNGAITALSTSTPDLAVRYSAAAPSSSDVHLDVHGYFKMDAPLKYHPILPCRAIDTRSTAQGGPTLTGSRTFQIQGNCGVPVGAKAVFANVIAWQPSFSGNLFAVSSDSFINLRTVSLNPADPALGNGTIVRLSSSNPEDLTLASDVGLSVDVIVDVFGYFE